MVREIHKHFTNTSRSIHDHLTTNPIKVPLRWCSQLSPISLGSHQSARSLSYRPTWLPKAPIRCHPRAI